MDYIAMVSHELASGDLAGDNGGSPYFDIVDLNIMLHKAAFGSQSQLYTCQGSIRVDVSDHMRLDFATKIRDVFRDSNPNDNITRVVFSDFDIIDF